jgi:hypothetical protein
MGIKKSHPAIDSAVNAIKEGAFYECDHPAADSI